MNDIKTTRTHADTWIADDYPGFGCEVIADSISPVMKRITTMAVRFPRFILAEVNTHRALSRNSASSRAIPLKRFLKMVREAPYIPIFWGKNQKGMQSGEELSDAEKAIANAIWLETRDLVCTQCEKLGLDGLYVDENGDVVRMEPTGEQTIDGAYCLNVHKETVNRLLEPFMWHTALVTATEWANFFALRTHPKASPAFRIIACMMADAYKEHSPKGLEFGEWHTPFADDVQTRDEVLGMIARTADHDIGNYQLQISAGRCARVSYLTQDGVRAVGEDIRLHDDLVLRQGDPSLDPAHGSPLEHQGMALDNAMSTSGNFYGYRQYRKTIVHENIQSFEWKGFHIGWEAPKHPAGGPVT